jgi:sialidase-1
MNAMFFAIRKSVAAICLLLIVVGVCGGEPAAPFCETDISLFANDGKCHYRLPSLLVTKSGTVLAAGQKRLGQGDDFSPSSLVLRRSLDGGKTFEPEQALYDREGIITFNGNLIEDRDTGTIFACFIAFPDAERRTWFQKRWVPQGGGFSIIKSTDDGKTWSAPIEIMPQPNADGWHGGGAFNNNHGVQLRGGAHAGRLVICARAFKEGVYEGRAKGALIYSDDHGATWKVGGVMLKDIEAINGEVTVAETADGEVYVNSRNGASKVVIRAKASGEQAQLPQGIIPHRRIYSRSKDGGETFYEEGCHEELFDGPCNAGLTPVAGPGLLFTAPAVQNRSRLTGYLSRDGGRTWLTGAVISEKSGGYSDSGVLPDQTILTLYENGRNPEQPLGLLLARYNLEWLMAKTAPKSAQ